MGLARKGIFFSITALLIVGVLIVSSQSLPQRTLTEADQERAQDLSSDIQFLENTLLPLMLRTQARDTLQTLANRAVMEPFSSIDGPGNSVINAFNECMLDGSCGVVGGTSTRTFSQNLDTTRNLYLEELQYSNVSFELVSVGMDEIGPWTLRVYGVFDVYLEEQANAAFVRKRVEVSTRLNINGLVDPYRARLSQTNPLFVPRTVQRTSTPPRDIQELFTSAQKGEYQRDAEGPSYLQRFLQNPEAGGTAGIRSLSRPTPTFTNQISIDYLNGGSGDRCTYRVTYDPDYMEDVFGEAPLYSTRQYLIIPEEFLADYGLRTGDLLDSGLLQRVGC